MTEMTAAERIRVWDFPTRAGHWLLAATFFLAYLTGDSEAWRMVHVTAGCALAGVLAFRLVWGFIGTRYARFRSFLFSPRDVLAYLRGLLKQKHDPAHWTGHNPAGSYAIYALLLLGIAVATTGFCAWFEIGGDAVADAHDVLTTIMLCVVGLHVTGVIISGVLHHENLVRSMIDGYKYGRREDGIATAEIAGFLLLFGFVACAVLLEQTL